MFHLWSKWKFHLILGKHLFTACPVLYFSQLMTSVEDCHRKIVCLSVLLYGQISFFLSKSTFFILLLGIGCFSSSFSWDRFFSFFFSLDWMFFLSFFSSSFFFLVPNVGQMSFEQLPWNWYWLSRLSPLWHYFKYNIKLHYETYMKYVLWHNERYCLEKKSIWL